MKNQTVSGRCRYSLGVAFILILVIAISSFAYADDLNDASRRIDNVVEAKFKTFAILVDGEPIVYCEDEAHAQQVLALLKRRYIKDDVLTKRVEFVEEITIAEIKAPLSSFNGYKPVDQVVDYIISGARRDDVYTVREGDDFLDIAKASGLTVNQIFEANPSLYDQKFLVVGQQINLTVDKPLINVMTVEQTIYTTPIDFEIIKHPTERLFEGEFDVKVEGEKGTSEIVADVVCLNGAEQSREVLSETVLVAPTPRELIVGSKKAPPKKGTGIFVLPARGYVITSPYGYRSYGFHSGIDLAMPIGCDVTAADGGVVTFAAKRGTYGYHIIIDHGDRKSSLYAHCSELLVKPGDEVFQGQRIALSGNSGRSTGPHLHFEMRIDNKPVNPSKFVDF